MNAREAAEDAYPGRPYHETGVIPWPDSFRTAFVDGWNAALEAARNEILDVTMTFDGEEFVFADDVVFDLKSLEEKEEEES